MGAHATENQSQTGEIVPYKEAAKILGCSLRRVQQMARRRELPSAIIGRHDNGMLARGIPRAELQKPGHALPDRPTTVPVARRAPVADRVPLTRQGTPDVAACRAMGLESHVEEWDRRMQITSDLLEARRREGKSRRVVRRVADRWGISCSTAYKYLRARREGGPLALFPAWDGGQGETSLPAELQLQIREFHLTSRRPTVMQTYREIVLPWYAENEEDPVHYTTVRRYIRRYILPLEQTALRRGRAEYEAECAPKVVRDYPERPNEWWVADHRLWDVMVLAGNGQGSGWGKHGRLPCPCGSGRERRNCCSLRRPWVTLVADIATGAFVGWRLGFTPTAAGVCHAVREAILRVGAPEHFYRDNGREFLARRLGGKADRLKNPRQQDLKGRAQWPCAMPEEVERSGMWEVLGIRVVTTLPYQAWSKPVESFFRAFSLQWENLAPGWCGPRVEDRPERLERQIENGQLLNWSEFSKLFAERCAKWNREYTIGEREAPPVEIYRAAIEEGWEPRPVQEATLKYLLQDRRESKVKNKGIVLQYRGDSYRFYCPELALYVGLDVKVRWDPEDAHVIHVVTPDGTRLAVPPAQNAKYGEWNEANADAARGRRLQRAYLAQRTAETAGATPPERLDPLGAVAMIRERQAAASEESKLRTEAEERAAALAEEQQRAIRHAENKEQETNRKTIYWEELRGIA